MIAIVVSRADSASEHIGEHLLDLREWERFEDETRPAGEGRVGYRTEGFELREFDELHIYLDRPAAAFSDADLLVFASRHSGETGELLTAHFTGNVGPSEFGGRDGELAETCPGAHANVLAALRDHAPEGYDVGTECTHHGPSRVGVPSMFVELGSGEAQWSDAAAARAVAKAILDLDGVTPAGDRTVVGFGGNHYAPRFERIVRETPWTHGHVAADWAMDDLGDPREARETIRDAFEQSDARHALVDGDYPALEAVVEDLGYRVVSETWIREVGDAPLDFVASVEDALCTVDEGLRFGARSTPAFEVDALPDALLAEAQGVDPDAVREAVVASTVAFETEQGGTRARGRAAFGAAADRAALVDALADVLREKYDRVTVGEGEVVAEQETFDPQKAHALGVPEGPKFGRLAAGQAVEVGDERVAPEAVTSDETRRFPVRTGS